METQDFDLTHVSFEGKAASRPQRRAMRAPVLRQLPGGVQSDLLPDHHFARWLLSRAGLIPEIYRAEAMERRVPAVLRALKVQSSDAACELLSRDPQLIPTAMSAMLIGVTDFMRDPNVFEQLRMKVLPELARSSTFPLRVWSAACSSGKEIYSVAMLLSDAGLLERSELLGTDCRPDAIAEARAGVYKSSRVDQLRITDNVRERVRWKVADIWKNIEDGPWDMILWRNAAIYLNPASAAQVFSRLVGELRPGGFLVLGRAERPPGVAPLSLVCRCIYQKRGCSYAKG